MKALTVRQPWAWAIIHGGKLIENRAWRRPPAYRGPVAIHAAAAWSKRGGHDPRVLAAAADYCTDINLSLLDRDLPIEQRIDLLADDITDLLDGLPRAAIIGVVWLADIHPDTGCCRPWGESTFPEAMGGMATEVCHLVFTDPRPIDPPIDRKGQLGLWNAPAYQDLIDALIGA